MHRQIVGSKGLSHRQHVGSLAPGLLNIVEAAEAAGWSVRRAESFVELFKPAGQAGACAGYQINSKWWCRGLPFPTAANPGKAFRVTAPILIKLLGLPIQG